MTQKEVKEVKQFLFDSCPEELKEQLRVYVNWLKSEEVSKNGVIDGVIVKMNLVAGRVNTNFSYDEQSQSLKRLSKI